jgi:hypothetical protein
MASLSDLIWMMDGPTSHGSIKIVNDPGKRPGEESGATGGLNVRRKDESPFNDLTDRAIAMHTHSADRMERSCRA